MNIEELTALIKNLQALKNSLTELAMITDTAQSYLETPSKKLRDFYTIDDEPIDHNDIERVKDELIAKRDKIKNVMIPEIDSKIGVANQNIARIEEEERRRAEQARLEEENRQRAAAELAAASQASSSSTSSTPSVAVQTAPASPKPTSQQQGSSSQQTSQSGQNNPKPRPKPANGATTAV